jgi:hypothetical protein
MFGRELSRCGREVDFEKRKTKYMTEKEASQYRLRFKNGKAYQYPWWEENSPQMLVPVESSRSAADGPIHQYDDPKSKFGFFTMSMSRDIYMTKHMLGSENSENGIYHSSYLGGGPVMCAGSMLIAGGVIQKVKSDSGHYKPIDNNMLALLQCLRMLNVSIQNIMVVDYEGQVEEPAPTFFQANADWKKLATERDRTLWEYKYEAKRRADLSKAPNPDADSGNAPNPRDNGARSTPPLETEQTKYTA